MKVWLLRAGFVLVLSILFGLSVWQILRGGEKQEILEAGQVRLAAAPLSLTEAVGMDPQERDGRLIEFSGEAVLERWIALDNRMRDGAVGYEWLLPVRSGAGLVLLNVGWARTGGYREVIEVPRLPLDRLGVVRGGEGLAGGRDMIVGRIYQPKLLMQLDDEHVIEPGWPLRTQAVDFDRLQQRFRERVLDFEVRLIPGQSGFAAQDDGIAPVSGYGDSGGGAVGQGGLDSSNINTGANSAQAWPLRTDWPLLTQSPARHYGYALQWFLMGLAWIWVVLRISRRSETDAEAE
ncbi:MAG: SURF1 family protein [Gammaproteobacteria bacterium AqS3]|nr:SURF1 family protein [Gammaproteobacteria bacterium AqS3]